MKEPGLLPMAGRPSTVPIKQVLNAPNSGSRTQFGPMIPSHKISAAAYSIGTEKRGGADNSTISPGPVYVPKPTSKWLGDAPMYSMSTSQRGNLGGGSRQIPGPNVYRMRASVGHQVESFKNTSPTVGIGTESRQQHTGKRNPIYSDTLYPAVSSLEGQLLSGQRSFPQVKIGTDSRFRDHQADQSPGPGNYKRASSIGKQVDSNCKTLGARSFGVRHSAKANATGGAPGTIVSPGPAGYRLRDGIGRQISSKNRSSAQFSMSTAPRFRASRAQNCSPGPGAYTV